MMVICKKANKCVIADGCKHSKPHEIYFYGFKSNCMDDKCTNNGTCRYTNDNIEEIREEIKKILVFEDIC